MIGNPVATVDSVDDHSPRALRRLAYVAMIVAAVGLALLVIGTLMPAYTDPIAAERVKAGQECEPGIPNTDENHQCDSQVWHRSMNVLRSSKWSLVDGGEGLLLSGLTLGAFAWKNRKKSWRQLSTPRSIWLILGLAGMSWLMQIPAYDILLITEFGRGYYPPWADTIVIAISQFQSVLLILFLPYMAIWLFFVVGARLPVAIFLLLPGRLFVNAIWTGAAALLILPIVLVLIGAILEGPTLMVSFLWLTLWLALCARAAALSRHSRNALVLA